MPSVLRHDIAIISALSIIGITPLLKPGFFASHDMAAPLYRLLELDICLKSGDIFPRWFPDLYGGRGGMFFNFYAPLSYYVAELFHILGIGYINSIKAVYLLSFVFSGVFMYLFALEKTSRHGALIAATLYMYAPYRFTDVFIRGDLAEAFSFVFLPMILLSIERLSKNSKIENILLFGFSYAGLILTHNITALIFSYFMVPYIIYVAYRNVLLYRDIFISIILAFSLSAFFWLPAIVEKKYVNIENAIFTFSFIELKKLLPTLTSYTSNQGEMAFQLGVFHLAFILIALTYLNEKYVKFIFANLIAAIFMLTPYSTPLWKVLPLTQYTQFSWRLLTITTLLVSLLGGLSTKRFNLSDARVAILCLAITLSSINFIGYSESLSLSDEEINRVELRNLNTGLTYGHEYLPLDAEIIEKPMSEKIALLEGNISIKELKEDCEKISFNTIAKEDSLLLINTYWFPGWSVKLNGEKINIQSKDGLMLIRIPKGESDVLVKFEETRVRKVSNIISILSFMTAIVVILRKGIKSLKASRLPH